MTIKITAARNRRPKYYTLFDKTMRLFKGTFKKNLVTSAVSEKYNSALARHVTVYQELSLCWCALPSSQCLREGWHLPPLSRRRLWVDRGPGRCPNHTAMGRTKQTSPTTSGQCSATPPVSRVTTKARCFFNLRNILLRPSLLEKGLTLFISSVCLF